MSVDSIHLRIGKREYPLRVQAHEEGILRSCAQRLNHSLQEYRKRFRMHDYEDALAMVSFDLQIQLHRQEAVGAQKGWHSRLVDLQRLLDGVLGEREDQ